MWKCERHEAWCADKSRYSVIYDVMIIEDAQGKILEADAHPRDLINAQCENCGAKAFWEDSCVLSTTAGEQTRDS